LSSSLLRHIVQSNSHTAEGATMNPLAWRREQQLALVLGAILGAVIFLVVGFMYWPQLYFAFGRRVLVREHGAVGNSGRVGWGLPGLHTAALARAVKIYCKASVRNQGARRRPAILHWRRGDGSEPARTSGQELRSTIVIRNPSASANLSNPTCGVGTVLVGGVQPDRPIRSHGGIYQIYTSIPVRF
jgi:hypothetical protein